MSNIRSRIREMTQQAMTPVSGEATIVAVKEIAPSYVRVTFTAPELVAYSPTLPADAIKLAIPGRDGNMELRAMTVANRPSPETIEVDILRHTGGIMKRWLSEAKPGNRTEVHAIRREFAIGDGIDEHLLVADASALPAVATILHAIPSTHRVNAWLHVHSAEDATALLPEHPGLQLALRVGKAWAPHELRDELSSTSVGNTVERRVQAWIAAETANVAMARRYLTNNGHERDHLFAAAYWKKGRDSTTRDEKIRQAYFAAMQQQADLTDPDARVDVELLADTTDESAPGVQGTGQ
ncbi:MAG: siderophore-interacting protein [Leucobacter sp.]